MAVSLSHCPVISSRVVEVSTYSYRGDISDDLYPHITVASSFLYHDMSGLLDDVLPSNMDRNTLLGPVLSSFLHNSSGVALRFTDIDPPVRITFPYPDSMDLDPICVYWKFGEK